MDASPLGIISNPRFSSQNLACHQWVKERLASGAQVLIPEITDYEVRRELLRANKTRSLARLNGLKSAFGYLPITTQVMLRAAELWAQARNMGKATASDRALDADIESGVRRARLRIAPRAISQPDVEFRSGWHRDADWAATAKPEHSRSDRRRQCPQP